MDGPTDNHWALCHTATGRRTPGSWSSSPSRVWPLLAAFSHLPLASGRYVGGRPLPGKETGVALVACLGSWGFPHHEQLGNRANVGFHWRFGRWGVGHSGFGRASG